MSPAATLAGAEAAFGVHISFAVPGMFMLAAFSWACICQCCCKQTSGTLIPPAFSKCQSFGGQDGPQRDANHFLVPARVLRDVVLFPSALQQLVLNPVPAKTPTVAG